MGYIGFSSVSMLKALEATEQIGRYSADMQKLDGVGPVDNRPSNIKLHHFVKKKIYIYI